MNIHRRSTDRAWWRALRRDLVAIAKVAVPAFFLAYSCAPTFRTAEAGGPDPREVIPATNGEGCWRATSYPINPQQARIIAERGWKYMPFDRRHSTAANYQTLWVPDYQVCGDPVRGMWLHGAWFYREVKK